MRRLTLTLALPVVVLLVASCSGTHRARSVSDPANVISRQQIDEVGSRNVYELVQRLHPLWLQKRGVNSIHDEGSDIVVYLDNARIGGPETLREIHADNVATVQFLDAGRAQYRFGVGHSYGAIVVTTRSR